MVDFVVKWVSVEVSCLMMMCMTFHLLNTANRGQSLLKTTFSVLCS